MSLAPMKRSRGQHSYAAPSGKFMTKSRLLPRRNLPIIWSEYNASYKNEPDVTDSEFMGPWLADTIRQCDGLVEIMAYWTFSDVFEEQGVVKQPFYGGFGLIAEDGLPKPSFNAFKLLHLLGNTRIEVDSESALVTRRADGTIVMAVWNLFLPGRSGYGQTRSHHHKRFGEKSSRNDLSPRFSARIPRRYLCSHG